MKVGSLPARSRRFRELERQVGEDLAFFLLQVVGGRAPVLGDLQQEFVTQIQQSHDQLVRFFGVLSELGDVQGRACPVPLQPERQALNRHPRGGGCRRHFVHRQREIPTSAPGQKATSPPRL